MPMIRGGTPATAAPTTRARGVRPLRFAASSEATIIAAAPSLTPEALPAVTVPSRRTIGFNFASASTLVLRGCSSRSTTTGSPLRCGMLDRDDLGGEPAIVLRRGRLVLAAHGESVLILAAYLPFLRDVLGRGRHRVVAISVLHLRVDEAPADRRVVHLGVAVEGARRLGHDEGRAAHALRAAGDHHVGLAAADDPRRHRHRVHARAAQAVEGHPARSVGQAGEQRRPFGRGCDCPRRPGWRSRG